VDKRDQTPTALLTEAVVKEMLDRLPKHRTELHRDGQTMLSLVKRGFPIKNTAPAWKQIVNAVFAAEIDRDE